ncbi:MAG: NYN domain-containing protein [Actinobacteria bacterium]|nr:NYN domain-containing protein [Actinomycetota bacterium]
MSAAAPSSTGADLPAESLLSALEFAIAIAVVGVKLRPPMPIPSGVKPYLRFHKLPTQALATLRSAIEGDEVFRRRLSVVATPELVDEIGMLWLTRPEGWHEAAAALAAATVETDDAADLRKEQRRRRAAEAVAARSRLEAATLAEQLAAERAARDTADGKVKALTKELAAARTHLRQMERTADKAKQATPAVVVEQTTAPVKAALAVGESSTRGRGRRPIAVPGGLHGNSEAAAEHLLRLAGVLVLVDGYNVAKLGWKSLSLERQRAACIDAAENIARRWGTSLHIVFDGSSVVGASAPKRRLTRVSYSPAGVTADDVLRAEVAALDLARQVIVVTNDQAIIADVRAVGANVLSSNTFLALARR